MGQLLFKKCFWQPINDGSKRTTIRRWLRPHVKPGGRAFAPGIGWLMIDSIEIVSLTKLTDDDARADGFASARAMRRALREIYPRVARDNRKWFRVAFRRESAALALSSS